MTSYLLVFVGAGIGGARVCGTAFPWGTLMVNVLGSVIMGALAGWLAFKAGEAWSQPLRLFLTTGILGGFTTFSTFAVDTEKLLHDHVIVALVYFFGTLAAALLAATLGEWTGPKR